MTDRALARGGERGLSLFEALIMLAVTALVGALLLPMTSNAVARNGSRANAAIESAELTRGEAAFRALVGATAPESGIVGQARTLSFVADPEQSFGCAAFGLRTHVTLTIETDAARSRLVCASSQTDAALATWDGSAAFAYSADGAAWTRTWRGPGADDAADPNALAPFVRIETTAGVWLARAGAPPAYVATP